MTFFLPTLDAPDVRPVAFVDRTRLHDLGDGFTVRRLLPHAKRRSVGHFVFFDHIGPAELAPGRGLDVRPHPHIGLATVTYLYEGALGHHDSLGCEQVIRPGDVNWMTAGRGIVHSERTPPAERAAGHRMHGIQTWVALPREHEETDAAFLHHAAETLPRAERDGVRLCVIAGEAYGLQSPAKVHAPTLYVDAEFTRAGELVLPPEHVERAIYIVEGDVRVDGVPVPAQHMQVMPPGGDVRIVSGGPARILLCGGAPLDGERVLWWNFVSSDPSRIEQAKADWRAQRMGKVPGDDEFIPLPER